MAKADILDTPEAGPRVIRGGALRSGGYLLGMVLGAGAAVVLLRHLGVTDFGRYVTVMALVAIAGGLTEGGLTLVGQRLWTATSSEVERGRIVANLVGIRLVFTTAAVSVATLFALAAGYPRAMVLGTLISGAGLVLVVTGTTLALPLSVRLRLGALTALDVIKQVVTFGGIVVLVALGATLLPLFGVQVLAGLVTLIAAVVFTGRSAGLRARFAWPEWKTILRAAGPVAFAVAINQVYLRILVVLMSLLAVERETGLFATAFRVTEIFIGLPVLMIGVAFPILVRAGQRDEARLAAAMQRLAEVALIVALLVVLGLAVAAEQIVQVIGGDDYAEAAPVLRIQAFAMIGASLTQVWSLGLVAIDRQRALIVTNTVAVAAALVLGLVLIPPFAAHGAAVAAAVGEMVLAGGNLLMLVRARPELLPRFGFVLRLCAAAAPAVGLAVVLDLPHLAEGALSSAVFLVAAWLCGAVPVDVFRALVMRRGESEHRFG